MNKILLLFTLMTFVSFSTIAQQRTSGITGPKQSKTASERGVQFDGSEVLSGPIRITAHQEYLENGAIPNNENAEEWIGETYYDLQSNGAVANRMLAQPDCELGAVWTGHPQTEDPAFPIRGTFFSEAENCGGFSGNAARIEPTSRTGWPNLVQLEDGTNVVINHTFASTNETLLVRQNGDGSWSEENTLPSDAELGFLWPRAVAVGNTIHVIGVTGPNDAAAPVYEPTYQGLTQALLYFRSDDGGLTWPIQNYIIPGTTSNEIKGVNADTYAIDADENGNVAIGIFQLTEDVILLKSESNGDIGSWTSRIVHDFPIDNFELGNQSYTLDDIGGVDPRGPGVFYANTDLMDSLFIGTNDGTGSVTLDANGMAHVSYSEIFIYSDSTLQEGFLNFFFLPTGIGYWNESYPDDGVEFVEAVEVGLDVDGSLSYDFQDNAIYVNGIASPVTSSNIEVTDEGMVIITYQQSMENLVSTNPTQVQHFSQVHVTASADGGNTWACPYNIINEDLSLFAFLVPTTEAIFPHTDIIVGDHMAIWYQFDDEPGLNLDADEGDAINANTIAEVSIRVGDYLDTDVNCVFPVTSLEVVDAEAFELTIAPNPAKDITRVSYTVEASMDMQLTLTSITGQQLKSVDLRPNAAGTYNYDLNTGNLSAGIYLVNLRTEDQVATTRLMIVK